ncbi:MAG: porin family protein, partial [Muribaculum sp.]|nr:porin family protein [Muribaculum sp.]
MKLTKLFAAAAVAVMSITMTPNASAQFRWGVKAGMNINSMHFNKEAFDSSNRTGWTAGMTAEFTVPVIGIGADLSAMFVRRTGKSNDVSLNRSYIEIPLNLKYKLSLPAISSIIQPYVTTGPSVSVLTSKKSFDQLYHNRGLD